MFGPQLRQQRIPPELLSLLLSVFAEFLEEAANHPDLMEHEVVITLVRSLEDILHD